MDLLSQIVARAKSNKQRIVLPEAEEERTLCAAEPSSTQRTTTRVKNWLRSWQRFASRKV